MPDLHRDLNELDRALAGDPAAEPELLLLVADVRTSAERPDPAFAARLDGLVAQGFPQPQRPPRRRAWRTRVLAIAAPVTATAVIAVVVLSGDERSAPQGLSAAPTEERATAPEGAADDAASGAPEPFPSPAAGSIAPAPVPPVTPGPERTRGPRKVERSAELTLTTPPGDVQEVADRVVRTTQAVGGYVQTSSVRTEDGEGEATFLLRVPSGRLDDALARLSDLGSIAALQQHTLDITASVDGATERLSEARAERRGVLRSIAGADDERELRRLRERLRQLRSQIARLEGELNSLRRRADLSTIAVTVRGDAGSAGAPDDGGAWTPGDALGDAGRVLEVAAGVLLVAGAVLLPLAALGAAALATVRVLRRRRREAALG